MGFLGGVELRVRSGGARCHQNDAVRMVFL